MAAFSRLFPLMAVSLKWAACALYFVPRQNEKYYDIFGAAGFVATTFTSIYLPALKARLWDGRHVALPSIRTMAPRQVILTTAILIWSARLGYYLGQRALKNGGDSRFEKIRRQPGTFTMYWIGQGTWNFLVGLPVYLVNGLHPSVCPALRGRDYLALSFATLALGLEVVADRQKAAWREAKNQGKHNELFISSGLWGISRHPNYVAEVCIWVGIWALASSALIPPFFPYGTVTLALASPLFTWQIVRNMSGVPSLEKGGEKKWGDDPQWQEYKRTVPVFWPWWRSYE